MTARICGTKIYSPATGSSPWLVDLSKHPQPVVMGPLSYTWLRLSTSCDEGVSIPPSRFTGVHVEDSIKTANGDYIAIQISSGGSKKIKGFYVPVKRATDTISVKISAPTF
ncbi:hypothetical protein [Flexivirga caeni]|uniref:hypothetical protein n=1 Tax=Flexivirga caeni TaxID=2294115 RepID=UPI0011CE0E01|nr:hypothetical protein [Flexivirga caeni]